VRLKRASKTEFVRGNLIFYYELFHDYLHT